MGGETLASCFSPRRAADLFHQCKAACEARCPDPDCPFGIVCRMDVYTCSACGESACLRCDPHAEHCDCGEMLCSTCADARACENYDECRGFVCACAAKACSVERPAFCKACSEVAK